MNIKLLKASVLSNTIPNFLIFIQKDATLCRQYIDKIASTTNLPYRYYTELSNAIYEIETNIREDFLYCIYNDVKATKVDEYINFAKTCGRKIILVFDELDSSSDFYKKNADSIVSFDPVDRNSLCAYFTKVLSNNGIEIEQSKLFQIIDYCNTNLGIVTNEIDKIIVLGQRNSNVLADYLLKNCFPDYREVSIQSFAKKVVANDRSSFHDLVKLNGSVASILVYLYNYARAVLVKNSSKRCAVIMKLCTDMFYGIIDGKVSDTYALKYVLNEVIS